MRFAPALALFCCLLFARSATALVPYRIEVVEKGSGWPVPLVELKTTGEVRFVTDNAGVVAFDLPECLGRETWLSVESPNYELPADWLGNRGFRCTPTPGGKYRLEIPRVGAARRVGRLTGSGLFGESQKLGEHEDWRESGVVGSDTVELAPYHGKLYWAWGDTNVFPYALGFFNAAGATSALRPLTSFQPPLALAYDYFRKPDGQPRGVLDVKSSTPVWVSADVTLLDAQRREHLVCQYRRVEKDMSTAEAGLAEWNDAVASGSVAWNPWRKRWVTGFQQKFGKPSVFGEVWYAEADAPTGPWGKAVKVLSHRNYTFYNVRLHQDLTPPDSPVLLFEGTYTAEFADHPVKTARYNYNQILYRLDLDDPALAPAH